MCSTAKTSACSTMATATAERRGAMPRAPVRPFQRGSKARRKNSNMRPRQPISSMSGARMATVSTEGRLNWLDAPSMTPSYSRARVGAYSKATVKM